MSYFSGSTGLQWRSSTVAEQDKTEKLSSDIYVQRTWTLFLCFRRRDHFFVRQTRRQSTCLVSDEPNKHKCHELHPAKNVTSTCYWNRLRVSARQATLAPASRTSAAVKTFSNTCQEHMKQSVYRVWMVAGRLWAACLFCRPGTSRQTDSGPRRSRTDRRCCGIYLQGKINRDGWAQR